MSRVVLNGGYGLRNFGDDALMYYALVNLLDIYDASEITVISANVDYVKKWFPGVNVSSHPIVPSELYIIGGGTLYYSFSKGFSGQTRVQKLIALATQPKHFLSRMKKAKFLINSSYRNFDTISLGIGYGPFVNKDTHSYKSAVKNISESYSVCVRDTKSLEFASEYRQNVVHGTDICFSANVLDLSEINTSNATLKNNIGIIVRDWDNGTEADSYDEKIHIIERSLTEKGYNVTYILYSDLRDEKWRNWIESNKKDYIIWNPSTQTILDFLKVLSNFDTFISARFHGVIFSTILNKPSISVRLEPKLELVKENAVCKVWDPVNNTVEECLSNIDDIYSNYTIYQEQCHKMNDTNASKFDLMFDEVRGYRNAKDG